MRQLQNLITKLLIRQPENYIFWITIALFVKGIFFIFQLHQGGVNNIPGFIGNVGGDTPGYLDPIDNLLKTGVYNSLERMPGYGVPYFFLRLFFAKGLACNMLIIVQLIANAISVYALALIARYCFKSSILFYFTFYTYLVSTYTSLFDNILLTESLTTSVLIFSIYFFVMYFRKNDLKNLVFAGFFLMWVIFLRQVYFPLILIMVFFLVIFLYKNKKPLILKALICFTVPFILAEGYWVSRNYRVEKKFIPFIKLYAFYPNYTNYHFALFHFIESWGGDCVEWNPKAEIRWFWPQALNDRTKLTADQGISIPKDIYTQKFTIDSLKELRSYMAIMEYTDTPQLIKDYYNNLLIKELDEDFLSLKKEHPFIYYIRAPLSCSKIFLLNSGTYNLFNIPYNELNPIKKAFKGFMSLIYLWIVIFGTLGSFFYWKDWFRFNVKGLLSAITLFSVFVYPVIFRATEYRYEVPAYPFLLVLATSLTLTLFTWLFNKKGGLPETADS